MLPKCPFTYYGNNHSCELIIPPNSPYALFRSELKGINGQSSYQILANQSRCPPSLNVHEFMAFQSLLSGKSRRWLQILVELGSTNLNFSAEATTFLISQLALETGPPDHNRPLGVVHGTYFWGTVSALLHFSGDSLLHTVLLIVTHSTAFKVVIIERPITKY